MAVEGKQVTAEVDSLPIARGNHGQLVDIRAHNEAERAGLPHTYGKWMHINCVIDPRDDIFRFFAGHESASNPFREYLSDGWRTLSELMVILESVERPLLKAESVLEFASGFGRFTRHLVRAIPGRVTCSDVLPGSLEFLQQEFGVRTIPSSHEPNEFAAPEPFELVCVLSLFTHLPPSMWVPWLRALGRAVKPGGVLVFSVCNEQAGVDAGLAFDEEGTHFIRSSESPTLDAESYGTTYTTRDFVERKVRQAFGEIPIHYATKGFWGGQDGLAIAFAP